MEKILYIYCITNKLNGKQYVGKHSSRRLQNGYYGSGIAVNKAIKKYGKHNFDKEILCLCENETEMNEKEIFYISKYDTYKNGYNMTIGGEGVCGCIPSNETRNKMSISIKKSYKENPERAKAISDRAKLRVGNKNAFFGKKLSIEHIDKLRKTRIAAISGGKNHCAKKVKCVELDMVFETATEAAEYVGLKYPTTILKVLKGTRKKAAGFRWEQA